MKTKEGLETFISGRPSVLTQRVQPSTPGTQAIETMRRDVDNSTHVPSDGMGGAYIRHVVSDGTYFRQATLAPVAKLQQESAVIISPVQGSLLNVLIERVNGQLLAMCLIDEINTPICLDLLMAQIEATLSKCSMSKLESSRVETLIENSVGYRIALLDATLEMEGSGFYSNAVAGLCESMLKGDEWQASTEASSLNRLQMPCIASDINEQLRSALETFRAGLDTRILSAIGRSGGELTIQNYNRYRSLGNTARHRRLQAAEAFPLIGQLLTNVDKQSSSIRRAVDRQMPLIPVLSRFFKVPQEMIRWLMHIDISHIGQCWYGQLEEMTKSISLLCPEHRPHTTDAWSSFYDFATEISHLESRSSGSPFLERVSVREGLMREIGKMGWARVKSRLETFGAVVSDLADISDVIHEIVEVLASHIGEDGPLSEILHDELLGPMKKLYFSVGLVRQIKASQRWHQLMLATQTLPSEDVGAGPVSLTSWAGPFDDVLELNDLVAVCLTNRQQLNDEGNQMRHCVSNYTDYCLYYGSTIISLRRPDGVRVSTVELNMVGSPSNALRFEVRQHRGHNNTEPPLEAVNAMQMMLRLLNGKGFTQRRHLVYQSQAERRAFRRNRKSPAYEQHRAEKLKQALKSHVGYNRFYEVALQVAAGR